MSVMSLASFEMVVIVIARSFCHAREFYRQVVLWRAQAPARTFGFRGQHDGTEAAGDPAIPSAASAGGSPDGSVKDHLRTFWARGYLASPSGLARTST